MKILVSNDDGITSPGIIELANSLKKLGDVTVVAPATEQSAVAHAITMKMPLRIKKHFHNNEFFGYAVDGTPADCIKIGVKNILKELPDLVVSGINNGSNAAINIIYSGTVSAAREAAIMGIPSIAMSITSHDAEDFSYAGEFAARLTKKLSEEGIESGTMLNVNVPNIPRNEIKGVLLTQQGKSKWDEIYVEREDPFGNKYFWLTGELSEEDNSLIADHYACKNNYVSVTPIHFDLTDYEVFDKMKSWNIEGLQ